MSTEKTTTAIAEPIESMDLPDYIIDKVPEDREEAIKLAISGVLDTFKYSALRYWNTGRIMDALFERGEEGIFEEITQLTTLELRTLKYMLAFFRHFPKAHEVILLTGKGVTWTQFKELSALKQDASREQLVRAILSDKLDPSEDLDDKVKKEKEKDSEKVTDKRKKSPAVTFLTKVAKFYSALTTKQFELTADLTSHAEIMDDEKRTSEEEIKQCITLMKDILSNIRSGLTSLETFQKDMQKVLDDFSQAAPTPPPSEGKKSTQAGKKS